MKKILSLVFTLVIICSLAACNSGEKTLSMDYLLNKDTKDFQFPGLEIGTDIDTALKFFGTDKSKLTEYEPTSDSANTQANRTYYENVAKVKVDKLTADVALMFVNDKLDFISLVFNSSNSSTKEIRDFYFSLRKDLETAHGKPLGDGKEVTMWQKQTTRTTQLYLQKSIPQGDEPGHFDIVFK